MLEQPASSTVLVDFDGTLAPIVDDPARAAPRPGSVAALSALAARLGLVGIVTGPFVVDPPDGSRNRAGVQPRPASLSARCLTQSGIRAGRPSVRTQPCTVTAVATGASPTASR